MSSDATPGAPDSSAWSAPAPDRPDASDMPARTANTGAGTRRADPLVLLVTGPAWLAAFGPEPLHNADTNTSALHISAAVRPGSPAAWLAPDPATCDGAACLPADAQLLLFASDEGARSALVTAGRAHTMLPDGADPVALWQVAVRLGLGEVDVDAASARALVAGCLAGILSAAQLPEALDVLHAAVNLATAAVSTRNSLRGAARGGAARAAGLWPVAALRPDSTPVGVPADVRSALVAVGPAALLLLRMATDAVLREPPPGLRLPAPSRPVLLGEPPPSEEPGERAEIDRCRVLLQPHPAIPAPDSAEVEAALRAEFPWMERAIEVVVNEVGLLSMSSDRSCRLPPILFVGPPGSGKSTFCMRLAAALGVPAYRIAGPDSSVVTAVAGSGRGWRAARPCAPLRAILASGIRNPLCIIDDADRAPTNTEHGTLAATLLAMTDPGTACAYVDPLLDAAVDISAVGWAATANCLEHIVEPLRDRMLVIQVPPTPPWAVDGLIDAMLAETARTLGLERAVLPRLPDTVRTLLHAAAAVDGGTLRRLRHALRQALGAMAAGRDPVVAVATLIETEPASHPVGFPRSATACAAADMARAR